MIIDTLENAKNYYCIHPLFSKAFEYLITTNLQTIESGKFEIAGDELRAIVSSKIGMTADDSSAKFECHNKHIDIQVCIDGKESIGWKPRSACRQQKVEYNSEKDVVFYNDAPDMYFQLTNNQFAIFFPEDVHAPMIGDDEIKKIVIKVKI